MKVAITSKGRSMDSEIESRFSRSPFFVIVNTETGEFKAFENPGASAKDAACVDAVKFLVGKEVKAVLTGNVGHNAFVTLQDTLIQVYLGAAGTVRETLENFKKRKLSRPKEPSVGFKEGLRKK
ncbi:MAG: dinitrogenase iron-molybdenum cofactor biosynthesis protein [Deltaproteobacteria bacterium]|nr:MAG: dinitrogenase iron-molybdenum cofactor biosynthesis protein [Deltaproteobacteria bacterium]